MRILTLNMLVALLALTISCANSAVRAISSTQPKMSDNDTLRVQELFRVWRKIGNHVWPGFANPPFMPRLIFIERENQWSINIDPVPESYQTVEIPSRLQSAVFRLGVTKPYRNERNGFEDIIPDDVHRAFPAEFTQGAFHQSIFFVTSIDGFHTEGREISSDEWIEISLHEIFHTYQDQLVPIDVKLLGSVPQADLENLRKDHQHNDYLVSELKLLGDAACAKDERQTRNILGQALRVRNARWEYLKKQYSENIISWERLSVWSEGTARYVEKKAMAMGAMLAAESNLTPDPKFHGYDSSESPEKWCKEISSYSHLYYYDVGFAYSLILDRLRPNWKSSPIDNKLYFDRFLSVYRP